MNLTRRKLDLGLIKHETVVENKAKSKQKGTTTTNNNNKVSCVFFAIMKGGFREGYVTYR
jgi:hypothetical protein